MSHRSDHEHPSEDLPRDRGPALDPNSHPDESEHAIVGAGDRSSFDADVPVRPVGGEGGGDGDVRGDAGGDAGVNAGRGAAGDGARDDDDDADRDGDGRLRLRLTRTRREGGGAFPVRRGAMVAGLVLVLGVAVVAVVRFSGGNGLMSRQSGMTGRPTDARSGPDPWDDVSQEDGTGSEAVYADVADGALDPGSSSTVDGSAAAPADVSEETAVEPPSAESDVAGSALSRVPGPTSPSPAGPPDDASPILPPGTTRNPGTPPSMASPGRAIDLSAEDDAGAPYRPSGTATPRVRNADREEALRLLTRAVRALAVGEYTASLEAGDAAWALDPTNARVANHMATVHLTLGEWATADTWCRRALEADYEYAPAWTNLGLAYLRQGHPREAEEIHRKAVERNPRDWKAMAGLAAALRDLDRYDEAMATYRRAVLAAPQEPALRYNMAVTLERAERLEEAGVEFERYLRLSGGRNPAREKQVLEWLERHRTP